MDFRPGTLLDGATGDWLESVAASAQRLVAVGDNGAVYTSTNGANWKRQSFPSQTWLHGVAYGNGTFITVGEDGFIATSTNGLIWTTGRLGTVHLNRVAYTAPLFTVVGDTGVTYTSANNGLSWISEQTGATNDLFHAASGDSSRLVVGDYEVRVKNLIGWSDQLTQTTGPPAWTYYAN